MSEIRFTVPGVARGKGRPRAARRGGFVRVYTDAQTASYENLVALAAKQAMGAAPPWTGPVELSVRIRIVPPASASKRAKAAMLAGEVFPTKRPDASNVCKSVEDGANAIVYADDAQIVSLIAVKVYADTAGVDVTVRSYGARLEARAAA